MKAITSAALTKQIQQAMAIYLVEQNHQAVCENFAYHNNEMDVASLSLSGLLHEFEVKVSRSDFLADKNKKWKWEEKTKFEVYADPEKLHFKCPHYFNYVCPEGLIQKSEIPVYAGLYYYGDGRVTCVKVSKRFHRNPLKIEEVLRKMLRLTVQRKYMGGAYMTIKNKRNKEAMERLNRIKKYSEKMEMPAITVNYNPSLTSNPLTQ